MELIPAIQTYDWGQCGGNSKVATLFKNINPEFLIKPNTPYAELWMGTHINGPSIVKHLGKSLSTVLLENPDYLGSNVLERFGKNLPYLFKVLSIKKALSIQVHPSKDHAEKLHADYPQIYKDPNHKPELAIALTPFEALCGFRPGLEIANFLQVIPELQELIGNKLCDTFINNSDKNNLKNCFHVLMTSPEDTIKSSLKKMLERFNTLDEQNRNSQLAHLVERLYEQFPDDVGCFAVYFLNYLQLKPLDAIYLEANLPHAYLYGDCIECMACSDNVIRAGLTPKFKDVETLCAMLNYNGEPASSKMFKPTTEDDYTVIFKPPVPDFAVVKIEVNNDLPELSLIVRNSGSILLIICGTAEYGDIRLFAGVSLFIPAHSQMKLQNVSKRFLAFQAMTNI